ncbi:phospholipase DDHD1-like isoform X2 [Symsagittifera roscoffensis]|uniref:phospholipase DDHD1-like isoform X2 n=1 Tax=Symsagittifera roscoffensis TaxID=84072 RepID=UPI00307B2D89
MSGSFDLPTGEDGAPLCPPAYSSEVPPSHSSNVAPATGRNTVPSSPQIGYDWSSQPLEASEVRWFFEDSKIKNKWLPFMGGDSLALENQHRACLNGTAGEQRVFVRGKLYEVYVKERVCKSIYWPEDSVRVLRGSWFNLRTWQPLSEVSAEMLEAKQAQLYPYGSVTKIPPRKPSEKPKSLAKVQLEDCFVEWYSPVTIHAFKQNMMSKMSRSIGVDLLGISKTQQSDGSVARGYCENASVTDQVPPVDHVLFLVHGIAQRTTAEINIEAIAKNQVHHMCTSTRNLVAKYQKELYPNFSSNRVEFLPIEWRSKIKLDEGVLDSVTLRKMRRIRELGNASVLDVLFYTSPLYTEEILDTVVKEIHRQYNLFIEYNPEFVKNGGKVSLIGHSLGSVICYDILRNYRTMDDFVANLQNEAMANSSQPSPEVAKYFELKKQLLQLEQSIAKPYYDSFGPRSLPFNVENYYAVGSPLGCFLALRGIKPSQNGSIENLLPKNAAKRFYNLFHPYDPVAFRLEPLLLPHYKRVRPVGVHVHSQSEMPAYEDMQQTVYEEDDDTTEMQSMGPNNSSQANTGNASGFSGGGLNFIDGLQKEIKKNTRQVKSKVTEPIYSRTGIVSGAGQSGSNDTASSSAGEHMKFADEHYREMNLEFRVDYELRAQKSLVDFYSGISTMPTAHVQYWESRDSAIFFLQTLMKPLQKEPLSLQARKMVPSAPSSSSTANNKL